MGSASLNERHKLAMNRLTAFVRTRAMQMCLGIPTFKTSSLCFVFLDLLSLIIGGSKFINECVKEFTYLSAVIHFAGSSEDEDEEEL